MIRNKVNLPALGSAPVYTQPRSQGVSSSGPAQNNRELKQRRRRRQRQRRKTIGLMSKDNAEKQ